MSPSSAANSSDPLAVVERYLDALAAHEHDALASLLAPKGFRYESPIIEIDGAEDYLDYIIMSSGILHDIQRLQVFADGTDVCHWLVLETQVSERVFTRAAQWARVQEGRITRIELLFDPYRWRMLFESPGQGLKDG
jgi:hypothetical protein